MSNVFSQRVGGYNGKESMNSTRKNMRTMECICLVMAIAGCRTMPDGHEGRHLAAAIMASDAAYVESYLRQRGSPDILVPAIGLLPDQLYPALHWAVMWRKANIIRLLVAAGADVNARDLHGERAIDLAVFNYPDESLLDALTQQFEERSAEESRRIAIVEVLWRTLGYLRPYPIGSTPQTMIRLVVNGEPLQVVADHGGQPMPLPVILATNAETSATPVDIAMDAVSKDEFRLSLRYDGRPLGGYSVKGRVRHIHGYWVFFKDEFADH